MVLDVRAHSPRALLRRPDVSTATRLKRARFSESFLESFWAPLFAGIQLDPELQVSSRRFDLVLRMLASSAAALPLRGMGAIPAQLAATLPQGALRLGAAVRSLSGSGVVLEDGEPIAARAVVLATDGPSAHRLLDGRIGDPGSRAAACCWLSTASSPVQGPTLMLDGETGGPAKNIVVISEVQASYAPAGRALIAAAVPGAPALHGELEAAVREQLARLFGSMTHDWQLLRTDVIPHAHPDQRPPLRARQRVALGEGLFVCGDHRDTASIQGAMFSGQRTAAAVLRTLRGRR